MLAHQRITREFEWAIAGYLDLESVREDRLAERAVATVVDYKRTGEEWAEKTNYFTVEVFGAQARNCDEHLSKGSRVLIDAEPDWREWTDQQGNKREAVTFKARHVLLEGARPRSARPATAPPVPQTPNPPGS
jgi:single-stranded DNA-binding protein